MAKVRVHRAVFLLCFCVGWWCFFGMFSEEEFSFFWGGLSVFVSLENCTEYMFFWGGVGETCVLCVLMMCRG